MPFSLPKILPLVLLTILSVGAASRAADRIQFNRDVRPILSENCYHCHGPDEDAREADLRLDTEEGAKESALVEGDAEASELIARIISDDPDSVMPPPDSERTLSKDNIATLRKWVDQGAEYQGHWSFLAPQKPNVPDSDSAVSPIDRFIERELKRQSLTQAPPAERETLIRRVTFDLIGLPPTLEEIDAFLNDDSTDAFERVVDRLMARKEFGERMASSWLDAARYSDTYGFQVDRDRYVWPWRDWVVRSFNDNMSYDDFITWQLAGDLLPNATRDQILATTFNRLHPQKVEGGSVPEEFRIEYVADRTQTVATALMGLTYECCRCHNHKYDPISQKEYYELSAFFDKIDEAGLYSYFTPAIPTPTLALPTESQTEELRQHTAKLEAETNKLQVLLQQRRDLTKQPSQRISELDPDDELFAKPLAALEFDDKATGGNTLADGIVGKAIRLSGDDPIKTEVGNFPRWQPFSVSIWIRTPNLKERAVIFHRSRAWTDAASRGYQLLIEEGQLSWSLIHFWPGNAIRVRTLETLPIDQWVHVTVTNDGSSRADGLQIFIDGQLAKTRTIRDSLTKHITGGGGDEIAIGERFRDNGFKHGLVDRFRVFDKRLTQLEILRLAKPRESIELPGVLNEQVLTEHLLQRHDKLIADQLASVDQAREVLCKAQDAVNEIMVMRESPVEVASYILNRGAYDNRGEAVQPGTPAALLPFPADETKNRLGLARWLCDPQHPLTSRVAVNRLWQLCFGMGLVRTPEDFGSQGDPPTHPDLLDWLAVDFVENGWDTKEALKQIMLSNTYQQASQHPDAEMLQATDPTNRWMAVFPVYRLPAEMLRDNALAVSGRLVSKIGGAPAKPYELEASFKPSERDKGEGLYRRSLYTYWKRTGPAPAMMTLDAAKRDVCRVQRERTSSPLQAFVILNGPQYVEAARGLAERMMKRHDSVDSQIANAFRVLTSRPSQDQERVVLQDLYTTQLDYFKKQPKQATSFLETGDAIPDASLAQPELAALTVVIGTLMNFDESMMKR
ncbi:MAG: DUF1553 domain-containing protein [Rubripirellula sp.]